MKSSITLRIFAAIASLFTTFAMFSAVVSFAEPPHANGAGMQIALAQAPLPR